MNHMHNISWPSLAHCAILLRGLYQLCSAPPPAKCAQQRTLLMAAQTRSMQCIITEYQFNV